MPRINLPQPPTSAGLAGELSPMVGIVGTAGELADQAAPPLMRWIWQHDWGRFARLSKDGTQIEGLLERLRLPNGDMTTNSVTLPAHFDTIRRWAGY